MSEMAHELAKCRCTSTPHVLSAHERMGTLAGGGRVTQSFCFECQTWLHLVDGKTVATEMVERVPAEAVRATRLCALLTQLTDEWRNMYGFRPLDDIKAARELGLIETKVAGIVAGGDAVLWARITDQGRTILAALDGNRTMAALEWLAQGNAKLCGELSICPPGHPDCIPGDPGHDCKACWMQAALAAAGVAQPEPDDTALLDALEPHVTLCGTGFKDASGEVELDEVHALKIDLDELDESGDMFCDSDYTLRSIARALLAAQQSATE